LGKFVTIGRRLKDEREKLGFNQTDFAAIGGVGRKSQFNYEEGERNPDAVYLAAIAAAGADIQYIVTGERQGRGIGESSVHQAVLDAVYLLSLGKKIDARQLASAVVKLLARPPVPALNQQSVSGGTGQQFNGPISGGVAGRNIVNKPTKK